MSADLELIFALPRRVDISVGIDPEGNTVAIVIGDKVVDLTPARAIELALLLAGCVARLSTEERCDG